MSTHSPLGRAAGGVSHRVGALRGDLAHAWRLTHRRPGFSLAVVLTLAIGIGANAGIFGLVDAVILSPLPYERSEELYGVTERHASGQLRSLSYPTYVDLRDRTDVFVQIEFARGAPLTYEGSEQSGLLLGAFVTEGFFDLLGVPAFTGRVLTLDDFRPSAEGATVLSERAWRRYFGSDPLILGTTLRVGDASFTVVGVMPASFAYPDWGADNDMWMPLSHLPTSERAALTQRGFGADSRVVARMSPNISLPDALGAVSRFAEAQAAAYPDTNAGWTVSVESLKERELAGVRPRLFMLWGAALLMLLMCCLNLSNLYLVQGASRRREYALRAALGAHRGRLFQQIAVETLSLAFGGGLIGIVLAQGAVTWARNGGLGNLPRITEVALDGRVMIFAGILAGASALLFAVLSARRAGDGSLQLRAGVSGAGARRSTSLLSAIQAAQFGMTFILLVAAWLLGETFLRLSRVDPGYDPTGLLVVQVNPPSPTYDAEGAALALYEGLIERVSAVPGVVSVALTNHGPTGLRGLPTAAAVGRAPVDDPGQDLLVHYRTISAGYFTTVGTRVLVGREFTQADLRGPEGPIIVNEALAAQFGGATGALGETLGVRKAASSRADYGEPLMGTIVGVVADLAPSETGGQVPLVVYVPFPHTPWAQARLLARGADTSETTIRAIESAMRSVEPGIPLSGPFVGVWRDEDLRADGRSRERLNAGLTGAFAVLAMLLASIGMYGVTSFIVTLRTREMGVRFALGAGPAKVAEVVVRRAAMICGIGLILGGVGSVLAASSMRSLLYEVRPLAVERYVGVAVMLFAITAVAAYVPTRRVTRLDPAAVLRAD